MNSLVGKMILLISCGKSSVKSRLVISELEYLHRRVMPVPESGIIVKLDEPVMLRPMRKDNSSSDDEIMGQVDDIIIEAKVPATATRPSSRIYLTTWDGYFEIDCSWVRESGMSKHTKDWWVLERELRYPAYLQNDFPIYDVKTNSLSPGAATENFISVLPASVLRRAGLPIARADFMSYITGADFDIMRLLNTLLRVTRLEELPTDNVPLMEFGQVIDIKEPLDIANGPVDDGESKGPSNIAPEDPSSPPLSSSACSADSVEHFL